MINILSLTHSAIKMNEQGKYTINLKNYLKRTVSACLDSKTVTFWKRQNYKDIKKITGCQELMRREG